MPLSHTTAPAAPVTGDYTFDSDSEEGAQQVQHLGHTLDGHTTAVLDRLGLVPGRRCLDQGAGAGSIAGWLAERVGPDGHVTAIDKTTRHIPAHQRITAIAGDINTLDLGTNLFDLVHARLLYMHLIQREQVLARTVAALKPGGFLVISDWDTSRLDEMIVHAPAPVAEAFVAFQQALIGVGVSNGMDPHWARRIPAAMAAAGLTGITATVFNQLWRGGEAGMLLHASNSRQLETPLLEFGLSREHLGVLREAMHNPDVWAYHWPMYTAVGMRPAN